MTTVKIPDHLRYVETLYEIEFEHDIDDDGLPIQMRTDLHAFYSRSVLDLGVVCKVICVIDDAFSDYEMMIEPIKHKHMKARVFFHSVKHLSPLVLLAMQADADGELDGV